MRSAIWMLVTLSAVLLAAGCGRSDGTVATLPAPLLEPTSALDSRITGPVPVCPAARGVGTISPAVSLYSITFVVNGLEQVVGADDTLQALPGDEVWVREATICTRPFSGNGGEACVDLVPVGEDGQEIEFEHRGTHNIRVMAGFMPISGPSGTWTIGENWRAIAIVVNHWPGEDTEDVACGGGRCERDDRIVVELR
jgi:hypothetical protein